MRHYLKVFRPFISLYHKLFSYPVSIVTKKIEDNYWQKKLGSNIGTLSGFRLDRAQIVGDLIDTKAVVGDLGAGDGAILEYLVKAKQVEPVAIDNSPQMIERLKGLSFEAKVCDLNNIRELESLPEVDYYLALEVIEHLNLPEQLIGILALKAKKSVIFSVPNTGYFIHRLRFLCGRFPIQWFCHPSEHLRFWTIADMKWWLKSQNINNYRIISYQGIPILNRIWPALFAEGMIVQLEFR